jgi:hypothetical protein
VFEVFGFFPFFDPELARNTVAGYLSPQSDNLQHPNPDSNYNHYVENRLDARSHGNEPIDQPQCDADHDQRHYDI